MISLIRNSCSIVFVSFVCLLVLAVFTTFAYAQSCDPNDPCEGDPCCGNPCCMDPCCGDVCCICSSQGQSCVYDGTDWDGNAIYHCEDTPIIIDTIGRGSIRLTSPEEGTFFSFTGGVKRKYSWTRPGSDDAFLVFDRNGNGSVDSGSELFGNFTPQPLKQGRNGFVALAVFDRPDHGGNGDGKIDASDSFYPQFRLWMDSNHNGLSELNELATLAQLGINSISLTYMESRRVDRFGNRFKYKAKVRFAGGRESWAYDVILNSVPGLTAGLYIPWENRKHQSCSRRCGKGQYDLTSFEWIRLFRVSPTIP